MITNEMHDIREQLAEVREMVNYLSVLQEGKVRPDKHGGGVVRDAIDNREDIEALKDKINKKLGFTVNREK